MNTYNFTMQNFEDPSVEDYFPGNVRYHKEFDVHDDAAWPVVLLEFLTFLGGIYGYSVLDKVSVGGKNPLEAAHPIAGYPLLDDEE